MASAANRAPSNRASRSLRREEPPLLSGFYTGSMGTVGTYFPEILPLYAPGGAHGLVLGLPPGNRGSR